MRIREARDYHPFFLPPMMNFGRQVPRARPRIDCEHRYRPRDVAASQEALINVRELSSSPGLENPGRCNVERAGKKCP